MKPNKIIVLIIIIFISCLCFSIFNVYAQPLDEKYSQVMWNSRDNGEQLVASGISVKDAVPVGSQEYASGVYIYKLSTESNIQSKKMLLLK